MGLIRNGGKKKPDGPLLGNEGIVEDHFCVVIIERTNLKPLRIQMINESVYKYAEYVNIIH